jgi:hypothetical protein
MIVIGKSEFESSTVNLLRCTIERLRLGLTGVL